MNFLDYVTEQKNTHMTHLEDRVLYGGVNGTRQAIYVLRDLRHMLSGSGGKVNAKWDGAPAVFAGIDPSDGKFFVAKKGIFNKNPKVYKTPEDIDADTKGDLNKKLKEALKYLPELGIKGVVQGDFLYSRDDLKLKTIEKRKYVTFHPNTIVYAVPQEQAKQLLESKIGIVWHTSYTGKTFDTMTASFGVDASKFKKSKNVWSTSSMLEFEPRARLTKSDSEEVKKILVELGKLFNQVSGTTLRTLEAHPELPQTIETFNNTFVRKGQMPGNSKAHVEKLIRYIKKKYKKEIDARKTEKGKGAQRKKLDNILSFFSDENKQSLIKMFEMQKLIVKAKIILINKFNSLNKIDTFVKTKDGYKTTGQEGYVAVDTLGGAVKLVNRMEFSYNNFSPNIVKGWESSTRN